MEQIRHASQIVEVTNAKDFAKLAYTYDLPFMQICLESIRRFGVEGIHEICFSNSSEKEVNIAEGFAMLRACEIMRDRENK